MTRIEIENDERRGRFVIYEDDSYAGEMTFVWAGTTKFIIDHTGVETAYEGKSYGKQLLMKAVEFAREKEVKIMPLCPFAKAGFEKMHEIRDVLA